MNRLIERCAMLDVHKAQVNACVRVPDGDGGRRQEIREFRTTTAGLITLADWLRSWAVTVVGMESTGVYWQAVFYAARGRVRVPAVQRETFTSRGVGLALRLLSDVVLEQSSLVGFDLDS